MGILTSEKQAHTGRRSRRDRDAGGASRETPILYKADGTPIWNPKRFVENISTYDGGLFNAQGNEIHDPQAFVAKRLQADTRKLGAPPGDAGIVMYTTDGKRVKNPSAFVAKIEHYDGGLYDGNGVEIMNPSAYVAAAVRKAAIVDSAGPDIEMYTSSGQRIRNPVNYVEKIGQYDGGLFTAEGEEIKYPKAFVATQLRTHSYRRA